MSTRDKNQPDAAEAPSAGGVNAYKMNRGWTRGPGPGASPGRRAATACARGRRQPRAWRQSGTSAQAPLAHSGGRRGACGYFRRCFHFEQERGLSDSERRARSRGYPGDSKPVASVLPTYRALVIGINQYQPNGGEGWHPLNSARADAEAVARVLAADYGFTVRTLLDDEASRAAILSALDELATSGEDGADLIYFAGHGYFDDKLQEGYWIPADARRRVSGRDAKEDWLWNSTITRLIGASRARHVLVMSDACYSGALFRGDEPLRPHGGQSWYERAITKPSRYLITSGGVEPVLDSGAGHSVFAQQVINYLSHGDRAVFSANDLGSALREKVAALTGQMVQMGPLPVSGHSGGEFVFIRQKSGVSFAKSGVSFAAVSPSATADDGDTRGPAGAGENEARREAIRDAAELLHAGAPRVANSLVADVLRENAQDQVAHAVADAIARAQRREERDDLQKLIKQLEAKGRPGDKPAAARPRVLACLGPALPAVGTSAAEGAALLYRIVLRAELEARVGLKVVEREALATLLQEQNLGVSDLADPKARLVIGKLLPASLLLLGDMIPTAQGETLYVRLVDTETTQVLASFTATRQADEDLHAFCAGLAGKIAERIAAIKPLIAPISGVDGTGLRAAIGTYHGVLSNTTFTVFMRTPTAKKIPDDYQEQNVGTATVSRVAEFSCELTATWAAEGQPRAQNLWLRERPRVE
jgi:hypothetical protein